jgi:ABC-2 type transport system permease protein
MIGGSAFPTMLRMSLRAYYRNRVAMFFSLVLPLIFMVIFGLLNLGGNNATYTIGVVDAAKNDTSRQIVDNLKKVSVVKVDLGSESAEKDALGKGNRSLVIILPAGLGQGSTQRTTAAAVVQKIPVFGNAAKPQETQIARTIVQQFFDQQSFALARVDPAVQMDYKEVSGKNLTYVDFAFVQQKQTGVLRRLMATPMRVSEFLAAQVTTRLIMAAAQVVILLAVGLVFFHFHMTGDIVEVLILGIFGSAIFIALGFAISGYARDEQVVPAIANIVALPMMLLSGIFYSRDAFPAWLHTITNYLPLTYIADALRSVSLDGSHLWNVKADLLGMAVWLVITVVLAVRLFRWEV